MPGIFISYRRDDSAAEASHLYADLSEHFGEDLVFRDIYTLEPGADYVEALERFADSCDVLVTLIGRRWLTATDAKGRRRLDDPEDLHRLEIATALRRNVRVIPVLLQGATMPGPEDLPGDLVKLVRRNAYEISDSRWRYDVGRLIQALERIVTADGPTSRRPSVGADRPRAEPTREPAPPEPDAVISPAPRPVAARGRRSALVPVLIAAALLAVVGGWLVAPSMVDRPSPTPTAAPAKPTQAQPTAAPEIAAAQPAEAPKPTAAQPSAAPATAAPAPTQPPPTATTAPATPPAQANPTEAAKPEPTRSPVDPILLADNFDDPASGRLPKASDGSTGYVVEYAAGEYAIRKVGPEPGPILSVPLPGRYGDASLAIDARLVGDTVDRVVAVGCRDQRPTLSDYQLHVDPELGEFALLRTDNDQIVELKASTESPAIRRGNASNRLELTCSGTTIAASINGVQVASVQDSTYREGEMWIATFPYADVHVPVEARFDNLVVMQR